MVKLRGGGAWRAGPALYFIYSGLIAILVKKKKSVRGHEGVNLRSGDGVRMTLFLIMMIEFPRLRPSPRLIFFFFLSSVFRVEFAEFAVLLAKYNNVCLVPRLGRSAAAALETSPGHAGRGIQTSSGL